MSGPGGRVATRSRRWAVAAAVTVLGLAGTACTSAPGSAVHDPYVSTSGPKLLGGPADEITVGPVAGLGNVLVNGRGITVYMFQTDHRGRPSVCVGLCAVAWPPLTLLPGTGAPIAGRGVSAALLGTAPRANGTRQITYDGWPLYTWPQDTHPGQATGQALTNLGGRWYVMRADGTIVKTAGAGP